MADRAALSVRHRVEMATMPPRVSGTTPRTRDRHLTTAWVVPAILAALLIVPSARAASPTPAPPQPRTCAERFPADGPGGLDLQLGCTAAEVVGLFTGAGRATGEARISQWLIPLGVVLATLVGIAWFVRIANRRLNRRMAPEPPAAWWTCPRCHSLNPDPAVPCYACGTRWTPDAVAIDGTTGRAPPASPGGSDPADHR